MIATDCAEYDFVWLGIVDPVLVRWKVESAR